MQSVARIIVGVIAVYLVVTMVVFALISLPEGDPAQVFLLGNHAWVDEAKALNRTIDTRQHAAVRYFVWLARVTRSLVGVAAPNDSAWLPENAL